MFDSRALNGQSIALAGLFQSIEQVQQCARNGAPSDPAATRVVLESVLRIDAPDTLAVYGALRGLRPGLTLLAQHLAKRTDAAQIEQARYAQSLMSLERRLARSPIAVSQLTATIRDIVDARAERAIDESWMVQQLANAYSKHISTLPPRVMISGEPIHLKTADNADRIRALLLGGLRAAVLWRQCGGNRIKLLVLRAPLQRAIATLLESP